MDQIWVQKAKMGPIMQNITHIGQMRPQKVKLVQSRLKMAQMCQIRPNMAELD
jgi:hypothetical protein